MKNIDKNILLLIACIVGCIPGLQASDLSHIYEKAKQADPVWLGALADNRANKENTNQSFANFLPNANLTASTTSNFQDIQSTSNFVPNRRESFNTNSWQLSVTQPIFRMVNYATHRQATASVRQSDVQLTVEAQNLILRVTEAYFNVLTANTELKSVRAEKKAITRQLDQAQKRFEVGLIAITDVHDAQASYDLSLADEIAAENKLLLADAALSEITGETHGELSDLQETIDTISPDPKNINDWVKRAIENNLSLEAAIAAVDVAREDVKIKKAGHYPTLDLVALSSSSTSHSNFGSETDRAEIGLEFSLPLYSGGAITSQTRQAFARLEQSQQRMIQTKRAVEKLTREAYLSVISDISRIRALSQAVVSTQSAVDATEAGFEVGTRTIVDVLDAQRLLYRALSEYQKARYAYILNGLRLKQAVGSLSDEDLASVNLLLTGS